MDAIHFETSVLSRAIAVDLFPTGTDYNVLISGGDAPHVGSVSVARPGADGQVLLEKIVLPTHRDDSVGDLYAAELARLTGHTVLVSCGIHYDGLSKAGIAQVLAAMRQLLQEISGRLCGR